MPRARFQLLPLHSAAAVVLVFIQALLPILHARHLSSHHIPANAKVAHHASTCCHSQRHDPAPASPTNDADHPDSCPTCLTFAMARQAFATPSEPLIALIHNKTAPPPSAPAMVHVIAADLSVRTPRGPPTA